MSSNKDINDKIKKFRKEQSLNDFDDGHFGTSPQPPPKDFQSKFKTAMLSTGGVLAAGALGLVGFAAYRYRVAHPSQYIVRTGLFIDKVAVDKKAFQLPFQTAKTISVQPSNYTFHLQAMSQEKMEFILPGVYTIGPKDEPEALQTYATLLSNTTDEELTNIIKGIIEGETRVLTASLSLEEIFKGRDAFRDHVTERVNKELGRLGLWIHNANIQEMSDHEGSEYFQFLRQRARANAENDARINIAEAQKDGDIAVKERVKETRMKTSGYEAEAVTYENQRNVEIAESNSLLKVREAEFDRLAQVARIESDMATANREAELQKEVETRRIAQLQEQLRSEILGKFFNFLPIENN
jgi:flotillin